MTLAAFQAEDALYGARGTYSSHQILLRLIPADAAAGRFVALNEQIEKLSHEIERRQRAELELIE